MRPTIERSAHRRQNGTPDMRTTTPDDYQTLRGEVQRLDAQLKPLDDEIGRLRSTYDQTTDRIEAAEAELRIAELQEERLPLWRERQHAARRFAVVQAIEDERLRRVEVAKRARSDIERGEAKLRLIELVSTGEVSELLAVLFPGGRVAGGAAVGSVFKSLGDLGRRMSDPYLIAGVEGDLARARRDLAEIEGAA